MPIITSKIKPDSVVYTDNYVNYNALDINDFTYFRINHSKEFAQSHNRINGTPSQQLKVLRKWCGI